MLSVALFGAAAVLGWLCARHGKGSTLLSFLLVSLVCAGILAGMLAEETLDRIALGPILVLLCLLPSGKEGGAK